MAECSVCSCANHIGLIDTILSGIAIVYAGGIQIILRRTCVAGYCSVGVPHELYRAIFSGSARGDAFNKRPYVVDGHSDEVLSRRGSNVNSIGRDISASGGGKPARN
jgi:hypothetical protein